MDDLVANRYRRVRLLGAGGGGQVWLAEDTLLGRQVAVKQVLATPGAATTEVARGLREARAAAALQHPGAVAVHDIVEAESAIVMEYVAGGSLDDLVRAEGTIPPERLAALLAPVAGALAAAHGAGIVHRDIKPANILIGPTGEGKLADFGIARGLGDAALTRSGFTSGTAGYFSPELAEGAEPSAPSDVWALGVTLFQAVEGRMPHDPDTNVLALLRTIATRPPHGPVQAGPMSSLLGWMLAPEPARRPSMAQVEHALREIAGGRPAAPTATTAPLPHTGRGSGTAPLRASTAGAAGVTTEVVPVPPRDTGRGGGGGGPYRTTEVLPVGGATATRGRRPGLFVAGILAAALGAGGVAGAVLLGGHHGGGPMPGTTPAVTVPASGPTTAAQPTAVASAPSSAPTSAPASVATATSTVSPPPASPPPAPTPTPTTPPATPTVVTPGPKPPKPGKPPKPPKPTRPNKN